MGGEDFKVNTISREKKRIFNLLLTINRKFINKFVRFCMQNLKIMKKEEMHLKNIYLIIIKNEKKYKNL